MYEQICEPLTEKLSVLELPPHQDIEISTAAEVATPKAGFSSHGSEKTAMLRETPHPQNLVFQTLTQASPSPCASSSALLAFNNKQKPAPNTGGPTSGTTSPLRPRPFQGEKGDKLAMAKRIEKLSEAIVHNLNKEGTLERDYRDTTA